MQKKLLYKIVAVLVAVQFFVPGISQATNSSECEAPANAPTPLVSAKATDKGVLIEWDKIEHSDLKGYKVVISHSNPNPKYSEDGYLEWITNTDTTSYLATASEAYNNGDFGTYLEPGESYYFSITAVYDCNYKVAGNAVLVKFPKDDSDEDQPDISCDNYKLIKVEN